MGQDADGFLTVKKDATITGTLQVGVSADPEGMRNKSASLRVGGQTTLGAGMKVVLVPVTPGAFDATKAYTFRVIESPEIIVAGMPSVDAGALADSYTVTRAVEKQERQRLIVTLSPKPPVSGSRMPTFVPLVEPEPGIMLDPSTTKQYAHAAEVAQILMQHGDNPDVKKIKRAIARLASDTHKAQALEKIVDLSVRAAAQQHQVKTGLDSIVTAFWHTIPTSGAGDTTDVHTQLSRLAHHAPRQSKEDQISAGVDVGTDNLTVQTAHGSVWFQTSGTHADMKGYASAAGVSIRSVAPDFGLSYALNQQWRAGVFGGYQYSDIRMMDGSGHSHDRGYGLGANISYRPVRQAYVSAALKYGHYQMHGTRTIDMKRDAQSASLFSTNLAYKSRADTYTAGLEAGYAFGLSHGVSLRPYVGAGLSYRTDPAYREGAEDQGLSLEVQSSHSRYCQGRAGVHLEHISVSDHVQYTTFVDAGYVHNRRLGGHATQEIALLGSEMAVSAGRHATDTVTLGFGTTALWNNGVYTSAAAAFGVTGAVRSQAVMLKIGKRI